MIIIVRRILDCQHGVHAVLQTKERFREVQSSTEYEENWLQGAHYSKGIHPLPRLQHSLNLTTANAKRGLHAICHCVVLSNVGLII